jgi:hypothetical protein
MKVKTHLKAGQNSVSQSNDSTVTVTQANESTIGPAPA